MLERFFDEAGGMQLVIHSPFGSRINRAWGLALRKRFCRKFNFELQAAATEDNIVLSLTTAHSFELDEVARYLHSATVRPLLIQALLDAPMFVTRWRWVIGVALALPRFRGGRKVPPQLARMDAEDLLAAVFPDQIACAENLAGEREIPDHPLVRQTIADCLHEAMDIDGLERLLAGIEAGDIGVVARDLTEPSPLALEVLSARPYAFLDDAPLEERRTQAVMSRRWLAPEAASDLGRLDPEAIARVRAEAWPEAANADELHDALVWLGFLTADEAQAGPGWSDWLAELAQHRRVTRLDAAQRDALDRRGAPAAVPGAVAGGQFRSRRSRRRPPMPSAMVARGGAGRNPARPARGAGAGHRGALAAPLGLAPAEVAAALAALEAEGFAMRGRFTPGAEAEEWCERRLLARIHRYTVKRLRAEIEPVAARDFLRFLLDWQRVDRRRADGRAGCGRCRGRPARRLRGAGRRLGERDPAGAPRRLRAGLARRSLPRRARRLDAAAAARGASGQRTNKQRTTERQREQGDDAGAHDADHAARAPSCRAVGRAVDQEEGVQPGHRAQLVLDYIRAHGASFFDELVDGTGLLRSQVEEALAELVALGLVSSDSFGGLRALLVPSDERRPIAGAHRRRRTAMFGMEDAGRWALVRRPRPAASGARADAGAAQQAVEHVARTLLRRYGVVFWRLLEREAAWLPPWRDLLRVYRRLEAAATSAAAVSSPASPASNSRCPRRSRLREVRRQPASGALVSLSGADPLNLAGILTPGPRLAALTGNRLLYRDGVPIALLAAGEVQFLETLDAASEWAAHKALLRSAVPGPPRAPDAVPREARADKSRHSAHERA